MGGAPSRVTAVALPLSSAADLISGARLDRLVRIHRAREQYHIAAFNRAATTDPRQPRKAGVPAHNCPS